MTEKKKPLEKQSPLHSITCGEIVAEVHSRLSNSGFSYLDFTLERIYVTGTGKATRGMTFFAKNAKDIAEAANKASEWIRSRSQEAATASL